LFKSTWAATRSGPRIIPRSIDLTSYEILDHTADTGIEARAASLPDLIRDLATGMFAIMAFTDRCPTSEEVHVEVGAPKYEDLVVETLSELLYEAEVEDLVLCGFEVEMVSSHRIGITARGVPVSEAELDGPPIKAVTYHDVVVEETEDGWFGRVYFDV